jgi:ATP synthase subunit 6
MFASPIEQFTVYKILPLSYNSLDFSFTNSSLLLAFSFIFTFVLFNSVWSGAMLIPTIWQNVLELLYGFVYYNIISENVKKGGSLYFTLLFSVFYFILGCNLLGLIPYSFTVTSHIIVTLGLATAIFAGINFVGIQTHGLRILSLFLPPGAPLMMAPLLIFIEVGSYSFRVVSLSLRLFANMMSGHCLLKILAGFAWAMFSSLGLLSFAHFLPLCVIIAIIVLEFGIAFLQAYVFTLLLCVYLNDAISLH